MCAAGLDFPDSQQQQHATAREGDKVTQMTSRLLTQPVALPALTATPAPRMASSSIPNTVRYAHRARRGVMVLVRARGEG